MASIFQKSIGGVREWFDKVIGDLTIESTTTTLPDGTVISPGTIRANAVTHSDGTSGAPSISFASEPTLGFYRLSATNIKLMGSLITSATAIIGGNLSVDTSGALTWNSGTKSAVRSSSNGIVSVETVAGTIGSVLKVDALPTVASGFFTAGTAPAVTAGSTPFAGSVNVGTGTPAASGIINFNGTAFPSAPFVVCMNTTTGAVVRATATTTQLTITGLANFVASDVITWICVSSK